MIVHELIEAHRAAFAAWFRASQAAESAEGAEEENAESRHAEALDRENRARLTLLRHIPDSLAEVAAVASHLKHHVERQHFDLDELGHWMEALSFAYDAPAENPQPFSVAAE